MWLPDGLRQSEINLINGFLFLMKLFKNNQNDIALNLSKRVRSKRGIMHF